MHQRLIARASFAARSGGGSFSSSSFAGFTGPAAPAARAGPGRVHGHGPRIANASKPISRWRSSLILGLRRFYAGGGRLRSRPPASAPGRLSALDGRPRRSGLGRLMGGGASREKTCTIPSPAAAATTYATSPTGRSLAARHSFSWPTVPSSAPFASRTRHTHSSAASRGPAGAIVISPSMMRSALPPGSTIVRSCWRRCLSPRERVRCAIARARRRRGARSHAGAPFSGSATSLVRPAVGSGGVA